MGATTRSVCPVCGHDAERRPKNAAFPFCSPKCKLVDLGRWLDGEYRIAGPLLAPEEINEANAGEPRGTRSTEEE